MSKVKLGVHYDKKRLPKEGTGKENQGSVVMRSTKEPIEYDISERVWNQLRDQANIKNPAWKQVHTQVWDPVWDRVHNQIVRPIKADAWDQKLRIDK